MINLKKDNINKQTQIRVVCTIDNTLAIIDKYLQNGYTYAGQIIVPQSTHEYIIIFNYPPAIEKKHIASKPGR